MFTNYFVTVYASTLETSAKIYVPLEEISFKVNALRCTDKFKWIVSASEGHLEYYNATNRVWQAIPDVWNKSQTIVSPLILRLSNVDDKNVKINFMFQNLQNGEVIIVEPFNIWISSAYTNYIDSLNKAINPP
jgi:hypothetical protein